MPALTATDASIASVISFTLPQRMAASLPNTLAKVPITPSAVSTVVGENNAVVLVLNATYARNATPQPRSAFISSVWMQ